MEKLIPNEAAELQNKAQETANVAAETEKAAELQNKAQEKENAAPETEISDSELESVAGGANVATGTDNQTNTLWY
jgi:hypothetical protein